MTTHCLTLSVWTGTSGVECLAVSETSGIFCFLASLLCDADDFVELFPEDCLNFFSFKTELSQYLNCWIELTKLNP